MTWWKRSHTTVVLAFPMFGKTGSLFILSCFYFWSSLISLTQAGGSVKLGLFGKSSTVKPCFVKFLSCLCFKLADLAKHLGECFIVASSRSSLAVGYLVGRLCLIVASCERLEGEGVMWADTHCSDSLQLAQGKSPWEAGQKHFFFLYEKRDMHFLS